MKLWPRQRDSRMRPNVWCLLLSLLTLVAPAWAETAATGGDGGIRAVGGYQEALFFWMFALVIVGSSLGVVFCKSVVRMATWLFCSFGAIAVLFFLLQAHFLAAVQLIVYVGGILVLIVFGIMLTASSPWLRFDIKRHELIISGLVCGLLFVVISHFIYHADWSGSQPITENISIDALGRTLLTDYLVPFELAAVLLMVIMIAAAYLARQPQR